ncbi:hypothetical protein AXF42_Ash012466 [Apostasia shenzhenica]|uniref:Transposase MuDR plant domain-containing protein n=1 Tax=Apostasia shenzhenica TaxID=1088818 RepID=A0A2I0AQU8_9ASPA|nr:hypothetical protein AXF42_Ash012466 [Apostasia shenzhenica]
MNMFAYSENEIIELDVCGNEFLVDELSAPSQDLEDFVTVVAVDETEDDSDSVTESSPSDKKNSEDGGMNNVDQSNIEALDIQTHTDSDSNYKVDEEDVEISSEDEVDLVRDYFTLNNTDSIRAEPLDKLSDKEIEENIKTVVQDFSSNADEFEPNREVTIWKQIMSREEYEDEDNGNISLRDGMQFKSIDELRKAVAKYCMFEGVSIRKVKNDKKRYTMICKDVKCKWKIHVSVLPDGVTFKIRYVKEKHKCKKNK